MRSTTKTIVGLASLGVLAASYKFGIEAPAAFANQDALTSLGTNSSQTGETTNPAGTGNTTDGTGSGSGSGAGSSSGSSSGSTGGNTSGSSGGSGNSNNSSGSSSNSGGNTSASTSGSSGSGSTGGNTSGGSSSSGSSGSGSGSANSGSGSNTGSTAVTKTGNAIPYRFGTVQVQVTKTGGQITDITMLQAGATGGRGAAFSYLVDYAIQAQGSNFGNISGATYTTDAFVQSLDSALAQF